jgi:glutamate racemase
MISSNKALYRPLGMFDAGIGSYAIVRLVQRRFLDQDIIYLADRASFPYWQRPRKACEATMEKLAFLSAVARAGLVATAMSDGFSIDSNIS